MVSMENEDRKDPVFNIRLSSSVPDQISGEDKYHEFTNMDLAMKLHYLKTVYLFKSEAVGGFTKLSDFKDATCPWLTAFHMTPGRIRRGPTETGSGRPFVKCNDSGIRYVEAECSKTVEEWVAMEDASSLNEKLVYSEPLGPLLFFSPLVYVQITRFKGGGASVGISWAHVLGDHFSAISYAKLYGQLLTGQRSHRSPLKAPNTGIKPNSLRLPPSPGKPLSVKRVDPVGDHWVNPNSAQMLTHSFHVSDRHLDRLARTSRIEKYNPFEVLSAVTWRALARVRGNRFPRPPQVATVCRPDVRDRGEEIPGNRQKIGVVEAGFQVANAELRELVELIREKTKDESEVIKGIVGKEDGNVDLVVYGANLTFVDLGELEIYGMEINGHKPVLASHSIDGVGDEGVVLILPAPETEGSSGNGGRRVTVILPGDQLVELKNEFRREWGIV